MLLKKRSQNTQYSTDERNLAMNIHYKSHATYSFLRNRLNLNLPSKTSIYNWTPIKHLTPGFNSEIIEVLTRKINSSNIREKQVSLVLDAASIRSEISYNEYHDQVIGFEDLGVGPTEPKVAKEMLVFMVRGDFTNWKCAISYYPSKSAISGDKLKNLIIKNIDMLTKIGFQVNNVITDLGTSNQLALKMLGVTTDKPFIYHQNHKIYFIYDICHIVKCVRNSLCRPNPHEIKTPEGQVSWRIPQFIHEMDRKNATKLCPKLTDRHMDPNNFEKMNVKLAAQVLSHSCASAIKTVSQNNLFPDDIKEKALPTAMFFERIDNTFDCFNR